jgi:hypothetical protein
MTQVASANIIGSDEKYLFFQVMVSYGFAGQVLLLFTVNNGDFYHSVSHIHDINTFTAGCLNPHGC